MMNPYTTRLTLTITSLTLLLFIRTSSRQPSKQRGLVGGGRGGEMGVLLPWRGAILGEMAIVLAVVAAHLTDVEGALLPGGATTVLVTSKPLLREEQPSAAVAAACLVQVKALLHSQEAASELFNHQGLEVE